MMTNFSLLGGGVSSFIPPKKFLSHKHLWIYCIQVIQFTQKMSKVFLTSILMRVSSVNSPQL